MGLGGSAHCHRSARSARLRDRAGRWVYAGDAILRNIDAVARQIIGS